MSESEGVSPNPEPMPCPLCSAKPRIDFFPEECDNDSGKVIQRAFTVVGCEKRGGPRQRGANFLDHSVKVHGDTEAEAIAAWNRRPPAPAPTDYGECVNCQSIREAFTSSRPAGENAPAQRALATAWPELYQALSDSLADYRERISASSTPESRTNG